MWAVWIGVIFVALKAANLGPMANWEWWWVLAPLAVAALWFEGLEKLFGRDRRKLEHNEMEQRRKERVKQAFETSMKVKRR
jgi:small Trp-rich protein